MAERFSKQYGNRDELSTTCNPKVMSRCLSAPDATYHAFEKKKKKKRLFGDDLFLTTSHLLRLLDVTPVKILKWPSKY